MTAWVVTACGSDGATDSAEGTGSSGDTGGPIPGLPDEHCPGRLEPGKAYAVLAIEGIDAGDILNVVSIDEREVLCAAAHRDSNWDHFRQFAVRPEDGALMALSAKDRTGEEHEIFIRGFEWLAQLDDDVDENSANWFQTIDLFHNDELLHTFECPLPRLLLRPGASVPTYYCTAHNDPAQRHFDLQDMPVVPVFEGQFVAFAQDGGVYSDRGESFAAQRFRRTLPDGTFADLSTPLDAEGEPRPALSVAGRARTGAEAWVAVQTRSATDEPIVERWSLRPEGIAVEGVWAVDVLARTFDPLLAEWAVVDDAGQLVTLGGAVDSFGNLEIEQLRSVVRTPLNGPPETVIEVVDRASAQKGDVVLIYGLVTGA